VSVQSSSTFETSLVCPVLVGRDASLSVALGVLDRARDSRGGVLCISGEAGIGKSRLVRAIVEHARSASFVVLRGACFEADRAQPYAALLDLVRALATTESATLAAHYFAPAAAALTTQFPELHSVFGDVAREDAHDPAENRRRLFHALSDAFHALSRAQPLLLVIEDVHWSDDATLDLLLYLAQRSTSQAIAVVLTYRTDEVDPRLRRLLAELDRARCATEIALSPLARDEIAHMVREIFRSGIEPGGAFVRELHTKTEGNPFFVEEMLKALHIAGPQTQTGDAWSPRALERVRVPRTAIEAVVRRLSSLSAAARELASFAAVAGRRFDFDLLHAITPHTELELLEIVRELIDAQLVVEESADRFAFRHALTREAILSGLLARERVALHRAIAATLEARATAYTPEIDDALAYHAFEAGAWEPARRHALRAASHALALCAPREALLQFERAVAATERANEQSGADLLLARGRVHETLGAFASARDDFEAALDVAKRAGDRRAEWDALHALGMLWAARDYDRAGAYRRDALEVARAIGDDDCIARSLNRVGNWLVNREAPSAGRPFHEEALALFEQNDDRRGVAETVDLLAMTDHVAGRQAEAVAMYERSVELFSALGDRRGLVNALAVSAVSGPSFHASPGRVQVSVHARDVLVDERAVQLALEIEWRAGEAFARAMLADVLGWRGESARALQLAHVSLAIAEELEHREWQCAAQRVLGMLTLELGAVDVALPHLAAAHAIACQLGSSTWMRWTAAPFAIGLARSGRTDEGVEVIERISRETRLDGAAPHTLGTRWLALARAELALAMDKPIQALESLAIGDVEGAPAPGLVRARAMLALERWDEGAQALVSARDAAHDQRALGALWRVYAAEGAMHLAARRRLEARRAFDAAREVAAQMIEGVDDEILINAFRATVDRLAPPPREATRGRAAKEAADGLTRREREIAVLVARGLANRAIGRALGIGERTVETHVAGALAKLDFTSRAQLAVWATSRGIVDGGAPRPTR
jgi:DNA-binding CsgD family transcriptional regulator/tetratricopeptide (TPR) repeat protein